MSVTWPYILIDTETEFWCEFLPNGKPGKRTPENEKTRLIQYSPNGVEVHILDLHTDVGLAGIPLLAAAADAGVVFIMHGANYDRPRLAKLGIKPKNIHDTQLMSQIVDAGRGFDEHNLAVVMKRWAGKDPYVDGNDFQESDWSLDPLPEDALKYAAEDVGPLYTKAYEALVDALQKQGLRHIFEFEMNVQPAIYKMEVNGLKYDFERWNTMLEEVRVQREPLTLKLEQQLDLWRQKHFPNDYIITLKRTKTGALAAKQPRPSLLPTAEIQPEVLALEGNDKVGGWHHHDMPKLKISLGSKQRCRETLNAAMGSLSTDKTLNATIFDDLVKEAMLRNKLEVVEWLKTFKEESKLRTIIQTFGESYKAKADANGYMHSRFTQCYTDTGRLSSTLPNVQNFPRGMQDLWTCEPDEMFIKGDFSGQEARLMLYLGNQHDWYAKVRDGVDFHCLTLAMILNVPYEDLVYRDETIGRDQVKPEFKKLRTDKAKPNGFGPAYGKGAEGLAVSLDVPLSDAQRFLSDYWKRFPAVQALQAERIRQASVHGYTHDLSLGRRRYLGPRYEVFPRKLTGFEQRSIMNYPFQSTGASMCKMAIWGLDQAIETFPHLGMVLRMTVHDSLIITCTRGCEKEAAHILTQVMNDAVTAVLPGISIPPDIEIIDKHAPKN